MIGWPYCFGLVARQPIMVRAHDSGAKLLYSWPGGKKKSDQGPLISPNDIKISTPYLLKVPPSPNSAIWGTKPLTHGPLGDIQDLKYRLYDIAWKFLSQAKVCVSIYFSVLVYFSREQVSLSKQDKTQKVWGKKRKVWACKNKTKVQEGKRWQKLSYITESS
jgi:hypothetical protein